MSVHSLTRASRILRDGPNVAFYGNPRTWKSTLMSQLDYHEGGDLDHIDVMAPRAKIPGWKAHYARIKKRNPNMFVTFTAYEDIFDSDNPRAAFDALFIERGKRRQHWDVVQGFLARKIHCANP